MASDCPGGCVDGIYETDGHRLPCITCSPLMESNQLDPDFPGLEHRFDVTKVSTGKKITDCFVLCPVTDIAARVALRAYAEHASVSPALKADLHQWVDDVLREHPLT